MVPIPAAVGATGWVVKQAPRLFRGQFELADAAFAAGGLYRCGGLAAAW